MTDAQKIVAIMHESHVRGEWEGETPEQLLARWANAEVAEVNADGSLYIEGPMSGHYLHEVRDRDQTREFVRWLVAEGVTFDVPNETIESALAERSRIMSKAKTIPTDPRGLVDYLEWAEVDPKRAPDCKQVLMDERFSLVAALRSGDAKAIAEARDEALRVARMWEGF